MRRSRTALIAAVLLTLGAAPAGCGSGSSDEPDTVDPAKVEAGIEQDLSSSSVEVTSAKCPSDVEKEKGATFKCDVEYSNGATGKATVTQSGLDRYAYALKPGSVQIPGETADAAVEKSLAAQGIHGATVNCPENIIVKVGTTVTCDVSGGQGVASGSVTYTFSDANGTVDPSSVKSS